MNNIDNYNSLLNIAKSAYGSGVFEGAKGGNGYLGQYTDAQGKTHVVKVLTHSAERKAYANNDNMVANKNLAEATKQLKANLIAIAGGEGTKLGEKIKAMLDAAQAKAAAEKMTASKKVGGEEVGLLSRKIVAQAVSTIAKEANVSDGDGHAFSWSDVARNRAATVEDTTVVKVEEELQKKSHERLYVEWDALEKKFGNWRASIPNPYQEESHRKSYILLRLSDNMDKVSRVMDDHKDMPFCKAVKSNCHKLTMRAELYVKLNTLNDNLTARQMLEELHDKLDIEGDEDGLIYEGDADTVAFRLFLEKRAAEEEQANAGVQNQNQPVQNQNVQNNQVQPEINELPPKKEEKNKIGEPPKKEENKINEPQQQQEIKVRLTPLQLAKNSCANYIALLKTQRDSQLNAIKNAGFSSPSDEWILKGLRDHYDKAIENANAILNRGDANEIKTLFGEEFENREEPLADDALKSKLFADSKNVLSKTLCSLALLSECEFGEDENNHEEYSNKLAGMLEDAFKLSDLDDFTAKLDRVKALVRPEGKDAACVRTLFQKVMDDFMDGKSVNGRPNPCQGDDSDYVDEHASFSKFVGSKELKTMLLAHLQGGKALERDAIGNASFDYAVQLVTDHRLKAVYAYSRELWCKLTDFIERGGHRPPVTVKNVAQHVNAMCGNLLKTRPTAFGGMDEVQKKRYSDDDLKLVDSPDNLKKMIEELFLDGLKERYDKLIANAANDLERECLARQRDEEVDTINGFIKKIERPGTVVVSTKSWYKRRRDI